MTCLGKMALDMGMILMTCHFRGKDMNHVEMTDWKEMFCLIPRRVEGKLKWLIIIEWRCRDLGSLGLLIDPVDVEYRLRK